MIPELKSLARRLHLVEDDVGETRQDLERARRAHEKELRRLEQEQRRNEQAVVKLNEELDAELAVFRRRKI